MREKRTLVPEDDTKLPAGSFEASPVLLDCTEFDNMLQAFQAGTWAFLVVEKLVGFRMSRWGVSHAAAVVVGNMRCCWYRTCYYSRGE